MLIHKEKNMTFNNNKIPEAVEGEHVTSDIGEAAYLKMLGFPLTFNRINPARVTCIFKGDKQLLQMKAMDYYEYRTKVDAKTYGDTLRGIKKSILEGRPRTF